MFDRLRAALRSAFLRRVTEREMQEEMGVHLERAAERLIARGMSPDDALAAARREFGNRAVHQENARRTRGARWIDTAAADVRFAFRQFARAPLTTITMILVLSLGIGVNSALFAVLHSILTRPAAGIPNNASLVRIRGESPRALNGSRSMSFLEVQEHGAHRDLYSGVTAWTSSPVTLDIQGEPVSATARFVSGDYFGLLGVRAVEGSTLTPAAETSSVTEPTAVIGYQLWRERFGGTPDVIGKTVKVNGVFATIIGVAPPRFIGVNRGTAGSVLWLPIAARAAVNQAGTAALASYDSALFAVVARLDRGVSLDRAVTAARVVAARAAGHITAAPGDRRVISASVVPLRADNDQPGIDKDLVILSALAGVIALLILLIACTNVSSLLVGAAVRRRREIAVRLSLGAPRSRIVRQLLTESILIAVAASGVGLALFVAAAGAFGSYAPEVDFVLGWQSLAFTAAFAVAVGMLFGLSPALHATRVSISDVLKDSSAGVASSRSRLQRGLVVAQIALTQPVLLGLAAAVAMLARERLDDPSRAEAERRVTIRFNVTSGSGSSAPNRRAVDEFAKRIGAMPGVAGIAPRPSGTGFYPLEVHPEDRVFDARGATSFRPGAQSVVPGYLGIMGIPILRGRDFFETEVKDAGGPSGGSTSIIMGSDLARHLFGDADPIGRRLVRPSREGRVGDALTIVGVVDAARAGTSEHWQRGMRIYEPARQISGSFVMRTTANAESLLPTIRAMARTDLPTIPLIELTTLAMQQDANRSEYIALAGATAGAGFLALFLASIGLYSVIALAVRQRTREIGLRVALGARSPQVVRMFLNSGLRLSAYGLAIGLPVGGVATWLAGDAIGFPKTQWVQLGLAVAVVVVGVASFATWLPARQAARVDPLTALRAE